MTLIGRNIGRYRILEELGSGGMSVVYKGLDTTLDREVAVKVLHPHLAGKPEARLRLAREAKAVARLRHPNIVEVHDFSDAESADAFIVTELIPGKTLRHHLDENAFQPPELAAMTVHEIAQALAHAHENGVLHRDLKPENVMIRNDGVLKLMDFGIAKILDRDDRMTMTGALVGSPSHMAPEIIEGEESGPEADVFSLGTMLYAFVTSRLPFTGPNTTALLKRILDGNHDDPRTLVPTVTDELADIIARCLARDPGARYADAGELRDALAQYLARFDIQHVQSELTTFFLDPASYRERLRNRIVSALLAEGEKQLQDGKTSRALASLNGVLAHDPKQPRALELLHSVGRLQRRKQRLLLAARLGAIALGVLALAVLGPLGWKRLVARTDVGDSAAEASSTDDGATATTLATPETKNGSRYRITVKEPAKPAVVPNEGGTGKTVPVAITTQPFGTVVWPGGQRSEEDLPRHELQLEPGKYALKLSCKHCVETVRDVTVTAQGPNDFKFQVQPKPARAVFQVQPPEAIVSLAAANLQSAAQDTTTKAWEVPLPPGQLRTTMRYDVTYPGYQPQQREIRLSAGAQTTETVELQPE